MTPRENSFDTTNGKFIFSDVSTQAMALAAAEEWEFDLHRGIPEVEGRGGFVCRIGFVRRGGAVRSGVLGSKRGLVGFVWKYDVVEGGGFVLRFLFGWRGLALFGASACLSSSRDFCA
jgi:hypothetical protein